MPDAPVQAHFHPIGNCFAMALTDEQAGIGSVL
jgi:hypothetical protein